MKGNLKEILRPTLILVVICFVVTAGLALTNAATKTAIEKQNAADAEASRMVALPDATSFQKSTKSDVCYVGQKDGQTVGYVFTTKASSYGGQIEVMTGISKDGKITGVVLTSTNDTPGLGLNAQNASFRDQYKQAVPANGFTVVKGGNAGDGEINALTGATITSRGVTNAVNEAITEYEKVKGGE